MARGGRAVRRPRGRRGRAQGRHVAWIFELKVGEPAEEALAQIRRKGYAEPYLASGRPVWAVGLSFDRATRRLVSRAAERLT